LADPLPYTVLSCCVSLDGCLDDASECRLVLSNDADLDRVDDVRAGVDAILVGAGTVRADDPRLLVRSATRRQARLRRGLGESPLKVTVTEHGKLDVGARFFTVGDGPKLVYCASGCAADVSDAVGEQAVVVVLGAAVGMRAVAEDLYRRGVRRLLVEGGASVLRQFLDEGLADELQLAVAPLLVGHPDAPRLLGPVTGERPPRRVRLVTATPVGDVVVLRYALSERFTERLTGTPADGRAGGRAGGPADGLAMGQEER
jgi:5-amino-6-(5-phosphoribosylamino)uracil reductase